MDQRLKGEAMAEVDIQIATSVEKLKSGTAVLNKDWRSQANCNGIDPEMFFAENSYPNRELLERICSRCDVKLECLAFALRFDVAGWWAGTTDHSRRPLRRIMGMPAYDIDEDIDAMLAVREAPTEVQYSTEEDPWL